MVLFGNQIYQLEGSFELFRDLTAKKLNDRYREEAIALADRTLDYKMEVLPASLYMEFFRNGNRSDFETPFEERRNNLLKLVIGALYEKKAEYIEKMADILWAVCEESTWVIPAHSVSADGTYHGKVLPDTFDRHVEVDLFSACTGAAFAIAYYYFKDDLNRITDGVLGRRMEYEIRRRILDPFRDHEVRCMYTFLNNWVSWVCSNVLLTAAVFETDKTKLRTIVTSSMTYIDRLVSTYGNDAGCNEGANYWTVSVVPMFNAAETVYDITNGKIDVTQNDFLKKASHFFPDMCIDDHKKMFFNFADGGVSVSMDGNTLLRMGKRLGDKALLSAGASFLPEEGEPYLGKVIRYVTPYALIKNLFVIEKTEEKPVSSGSSVYPDLEVAVYRENGFAVAVKGGHNRESHNHNDVGSLIVYHHADPVFIDVGPMEYTKETFGPNRYSIWVNRSLYHNVPEINGKEQLPGAEYRADKFRADSHSCLVEYRSAYPKDAGISSLTRELKIENGKIILLDHAEADGQCVFHFMLAKKPVISGNTVKVSGCSIVFENANRIESEPVALTSPRLIDAWKTETLYRLCIYGKNIRTVLEAEK